jgi:hypothetical protein
LGGVEDPRLAIYTGGPRTVKADNDSTLVGNKYYKNGSYYIGVPYGIASSNMTSAFRNIAPNIYAAQPVVLR